VTKVGFVSHIENETEGTTFWNSVWHPKVLDSIQDNDFHGAFEACKKDGIAVYVPKETILKEMAAKIE
jgi:hypothetical protein